MTTLEIVLVVAVAAQSGVLGWALSTRRPSGLARTLAVQSEALAMLAHRGMNAALLQPHEQLTRVQQEELTDAEKHKGDDEGPSSVPGGLSAAWQATGQRFDGQGRPLVGMP